MKYITEYECYDCGQLCKTEKVLVSHIWKHLNICCLCCVCHKEFKSKQGAFQHRRNVHHFHGDWAPKWRCGICRTIVNDNQIRAHVERCQKRNRNKTKSRAEWLDNPENREIDVGTVPDTKDEKQYTYNHINDIRHCFSNRVVFICFFFLYLKF